MNHLDELFKHLSSLLDRMSAPGSDGKAAFDTMMARIIADKVADVRADQLNEEAEFLVAYAEGNVSPQDLLSRYKCSVEVVRESVIAKIARAARARDKQSKPSTDETNHNDSQA